MPTKTKTERELKTKPPSSSRRWIFALLMLFLSISWTISLVTYSEYDWPEVASKKTNENALGPVGNGLAYITIYALFGYLPAFVIPLLFLIHSIYLFSPTKKIPYFRLYLPLGIMAWLLGCWISFYQTINPIDVNWFYSGFLSHHSIQLFNRWLNVLGTVLVLLFLTLTIIGLTFGKHLLSFFRWFFRLFKRAKVDGEDTKGTAAQQVDFQKEETPKSAQPSVLKQIDFGDNKVENVQIKESEQNVPIIVTPDPIPIVEENIPNPIAQELEYKLPPLDLFEKGDTSIPSEPYEELAEKLQKTLKEFNVTAQINKIHPGPIVTRYDFIPGPGVKVSSFTTLSDDLARAMKAVSVRVLAPIPGTDAVGIEIPNQNPRIVRIREVLESSAFQQENLILPVALGLSTDGQPRITDLARLPHLLIAGATGSGKSVLINALLASILIRRTPNEVRIALIDPKQVELSPYKVLVHHHLIKMVGADAVVSKPTEAVRLLQACVLEMERRLELLTTAGVRDLREYQQKHREGDEKASEQLCYLVVVIDELADLMLSSAKEVEDPIQRIAQKARAVGIHLVVATQRPSVNVITGVIKANLTTRLVFQVASQVDSRTVIEQSGAEKLLGKGDALFALPGAQKPERIHCGLIEGKETEKLLQWIVQQPKAIPLELQPPNETQKESFGDTKENGEFDSLFSEAARLMVRQQQGSVALIQRRFKVGYARAGRILDQLERNGIVGPFDGSKPREVLIKNLEDLEELLNKLGLND